MRTARSSRPWRGQRCARGGRRGRPRGGALGSVHDLPRCVVQTGQVPHVDLDHDRSPLEDFVALHSANDAGDLHRRLLCFGDGGGNKADAFEPWCLFHKVHADEPDGAAATALLLLTDRRWRNATSRLVRRIEESGLVPDDHLDLLAQTFLAAGPQVYWEAPGDWFGGPTIVLDPGASDAVGVIEDKDPDEPDDGPVVFAREIRPPLRRWAATRAVRSDPASWGALVKRARQVDPRGGGAIIHGLVDSIERLAPAARDVLFEIAENWPHRKLREAATALRHPPELAQAAPGVVATAVQGTAARPTAQPSLF